ncbi:MAG: hypothetical protein SGARI_002005 [Bacillariaceae sp.]
MPNISDAPIANASNYLKLAMRHKELDKRKEYCEKALAQLSAIDRSHESNRMGKSKFFEDIEMTILKGKAEFLSQDYKTAIETYESSLDWVNEAAKRFHELESLTKRGREIEHNPQRREEFNQINIRLAELLGQGIVKTGQHIEWMFGFADALKHAKEWEGAKTTYGGLMSEYGFGGRYSGENGRPMFDVFNGSSECAYHLMDYEASIQFGEMMIEVCRPYNWGHKYMALSQKAQGKLEEAKQTAARAVVYEAPWDDKHKEEVEQWYKENF